ncbi:MAG: S-layer homology domain-containing protein [Sulfobacillus sp.]
MSRRLFRLMAVLYVLCALVSATPVSASGFSDLPQVPWAAPEITLLADQGALLGVGGGRFDPSAAVSREAVAVILSRILALHSKASLADFADQATVSLWARAQVAEAVAAGLLKGEGALLAPLQPLSRAQAAVLLWRLAGQPAASSAAPAFADQAAIPSWAVAAVQSLTSLGVITGEPGHLFEPDGVVSRAQLAVMLARLEPDLAALPGLPTAVAGRVGQWIAPNQAGLAVQSQIAGVGGGVLMASGKLWPLASSAAIWLGQSRADLYALAAGDPLAGVLGPDGTLDLVLDFGPGASFPLTVENASDNALFMSDGSVWPVTAPLVATMGTVTAPVFPSDLVGAVLAKPLQPGLALDLAQITVPNLSGTVSAESATSITLTAANAPTPFLTAGSWTLVTSAQTSYNGPSGNGTMPPLGAQVTVLATLAASGTLTAQVVAW